MTKRVRSAFSREPFLVLALAAFHTHTHTNGAVKGSAYRLDIRHEVAFGRNKKTIQLSLSVWENAAIEKSILQGLCAFLFLFPQSYKSGIR